MRALAAKLLGLFGMVAAAFVGLGRTGGAVALAVACGFVLLVGLAADLPPRDRGR